MNRYIYRISVLCTMFLLAACEKTLDLFPPGAISENVFWTQEKDAELAVNAVYRELDEVNMVINLDGTSDLGYVRNGWVTWYRVGMGNHDALDAEITNVWTRYYRGIRRANDVINNVNKIPNADPELMQRITSEARFLRAYFYTNLTSLWGDVPLILETLKITDQVPRESKSVIVDFILSELDDIASILPASYSGADIGRITKGAALALKARVYLRNERWKEAAETAQSVMDLGIYSLHPNYGALFTYAGENSNEIILANQYAKGGQVHSALSWGPNSIGGSTSAEPIRKLFEKYAYQGPKNPADPYENIDPRWGFTCYYPGAAISDKLLYNSYPYADNTTADKVNTQDNTTSHGWNIRKYIDYANDAANPSQGAINLILIRYADVLLMYAEAKIELNEIDQSVYDAVNALRDRPSVSMPHVAIGLSQNEWRTTVRNERAVELAFEGLRLYDLYRWKAGSEKVGLIEGFDYINPSTGKSSIWNIGVKRNFNENRDYLWPIPQREIDLNKSLTQNPNW